MFLTIVLPLVFVMAHIECCRETETAIFAARTNLPILDFQTWQVCYIASKIHMCHALKTLITFHVKQQNRKERAMNSIITIDVSCCHREATNPWMSRIAASVSLKPV